jgi:hypothetical protein
VGGRHRPESLIDLASDPTDDPRWRPVLNGAWMQLLPGAGRRAYRRRTGTQGTNGLTVLRALFRSFCFALVMVGVLVAVLTNTPPPFNRHPLNALPVAIGIVVFGGLWRGRPTTHRAPSRLLQ